MTICLTNGIEQTGGSRWVLRNGLRFSKGHRAGAHPGALSVSKAEHA